MKAVLKAAISILAAIFIVVGITTATAGAQDTFKPSVNTFFWLQVGMFNNEADDGRASFDFKRARFGIKGNVHPKISYHLMIEGAHKGDEFRLYQAWMTYHLHPLANIRVGQFKYPFTMDSYPGFVWWKFYNPSLGTIGIGKELGRKSGTESGLFRDIGVELSGKYKFNDDYTGVYNLMIMNGNGILKSDNNDKKDFVGRVGIMAPHGIQAGAAVYFGQYRPDAGQIDYNESGISTYFKWDHNIKGYRFHLMGEYVMATNKTGGDDIEAEGYYGYATFFPVRELEFGGRYSHYEPDKNSAVAEESEEQMLLVAYYFDDGQKIMINYDLDGDNYLTVVFQITLGAKLL